MHTKKGPYKWKFMYVDNIKGLRVLKDHFSEGDIPPDANPNGDELMDEIIIMVGMPKSNAEEWRRNHNMETGDFVSPVQRVRKENPNMQGAITKKGNGNVNSLANLNIPKKNNPGTKQPNYDYKAAQKNLQDFNKNYTQQDRQQKFADWDKARAEVEKQQQTNQQGPITQKNMNDDEDFFTRPNNNA
jgi:hypothetical protein